MAFGHRCGFRVVVMELNGTNSAVMIVPPLAYALPDVQNIKLTHKYEPEERAHDRLQRRYALQFDGRVNAQ